MKLNKNNTRFLINIDLSFVCHLSIKKKCINNERNSKVLFLQSFYANAAIIIKQIHYMIFKYITEIKTYERFFIQKSLSR